MASLGDISKACAFGNPRYSMGIAGGIWPSISRAMAVAHPIKFGSEWGNIKKPVNVTVLLEDATALANVVLTNKGLTTDLARADGAGDVYFYDFDDGIYYAHEFETANTWRVTITGATVLVEPVTTGGGGVSGTRAYGFIA